MVAEHVAAGQSEAEALLASGDPATEISQAAAREDCDLIAMSTYGFSPGSSSAVTSSSGVRLLRRMNSPDWSWLVRPRAVAS